MEMEQKKIHVFTSSAINYLPKVRQLAASIKHFHPEIIFHLALADCSSIDLGSYTGPNIDEVHPIDTLGIPAWRPWAFQHGIVELSTAIKPFMLLSLLQRKDCKSVFYFDPDMVVFSNLSDLFSTLDSASIALTPHQVTPDETVEAILDNEICSLKHGVFNLGFIGVSPDSEGRRFAEWWAKRTYHFCRDDIPNGLFTDQKWIDLVPAFFERVSIVKSSRHNVAPWNLTTRYVSGSIESGLTVDNQPLGFYHFTGFDSGAHAVMARKNSRGNEVVQSLVEWYRELTLNDGSDPSARIPWGFGRFSDGTGISDAERLTYREREDLREAFPDPFEVHASGQSFFHWCRTQGQREYPDRFKKKVRCTSD
jgi:hypothetical protein